MKPIRFSIFVLAILTVASARFAVASHDQLDRSFGSGGIVTTAIRDYIDVANSIALQPDGKIVLGGGSNARDQEPDSVFALARYNTDGSLDTSFGVAGKVTTAIDSEAGAASLAIQSDGKILAAGSTYDHCNNCWNSKFALVRYNVDGSLDASFGDGGKVITDLSSEVGEPEGIFEIEVQVNGKILAVGVGKPPSETNDQRIVLVRYLSDGSLDDSFGTGGTVQLGVYDMRGDASIAIQTDGKIVVAGSYQGLDSNDIGDFVLMRYNPDGTPDINFGFDGRVSTSFSREDWPSDFAVQSDGKLVLVGAAADWVEAQIGEDRTSDFALARYNYDGSLDASFGTGGKVTTDFAQLDVARAVVIQPDGKLVVTGDGGEHLQGTAVRLARYNTDGSLDTSFGVNGKITTNVDDEYDTAFDAVLQSDGSIVVAGSSDDVGGLSDGGTKRNFLLLRYLKEPDSHIDPAVLWFITRGNWVEEE